MRAQVAGRRSGGTARVRVTEVRTDAGARRHEDRVVGEEPLQVRCTWPGTPAYDVGVTMRTPGHDFELAAGLLVASGTIRPAGDQPRGGLHTVAYCRDRSLVPEERRNVVTVTLSGRPDRVPTPRTSSAADAGSACGVCGTTSLGEVLDLHTGAAARGRTSAPHPVVDPAVVHRLPDLLRAEQQLFEQTGGLHAAGLFTAGGDPVVVREDVGRHNAVDKVVGARLLEGSSPALPVLAVSGRIGFEIVQKAVLAGVGVLAAVGAPTSLAVELASGAGLCTVGFVRPHRMVVYSVPERLGL